MWCWVQVVIHQSLPLSVPGDNQLSGYDVKSNVSCLLGELYEPTDPRRDGGFSLMYAAGNVGSIIAPIACGYAQETSLAMGFRLAAVGMIRVWFFLMWQSSFRALPAALTKKYCVRQTFCRTGDGCSFCWWRCPCADYRTVLERMVEIWP